MNFDSVMASVSARLMGTVISEVPNAEYRPPKGGPSRLVRLALQAPLATRELPAGGDEITVHRSTAHVLASELPLPEIGGRFVMTATGEAWSIVERPALNASVWDIEVAAGGREQVGTVRERD